MTIRSRGAGLGIAVIVAAGAALGAQPSHSASPTEESVAFERVGRIFESHCAQCHTGSHPKLGLHLETDQIYRATVNVRSRASRRDRLVVPGDPWSSALYLRLLPPSEGAYRGPRMPMKGSLTDAEIDTVRVWIESFPSSTWGAPHPTAGRLLPKAPAGEGASDSAPPGSRAETVSPEPGEAAAIPPGSTPRPASGSVAGASSRTTAPSSAGPERPKLYAPLFHDRFLADLPSPDTLGRQMLEFRFTHRFKASVTEAGADNLWGLDSGAWISLGLAYGINDRLDVGLRRTDQMQDYEGFFKAALVRQRRGESPISLALYGSFMRLDATGLENRNRWSEQIIIARRFAEWLSVEIVPTYVSHTNFLNGEDTRGTLALGAAAEVRLNSYLALTGEWIGQRGGVRAPRQAGTVGLSLRTSNHVFHILFTNAQNTHTDLYAPGGDLDWGGGDFRLGFNISRTFDPMHPQP